MDLKEKEFKDLTGMTFNHFTVISYAGKKYKNNNTRVWLCECDCENKTRKEISEYRLIKGETKSCGCIRKKTTEEYKLELEEINKKNGTNIKLKEGVEYARAGTKIIHICTCGKEWNTIPSTILNGAARSCGLCHSCTFEQWCFENNRQDILDRWDYELNDCKPSEITHAISKKYYFKCPRELHESELKKISAFTSGQEGSMRCNVCNSFAQWGLDNIGIDFLDKYWDYEKNNELGIDPWKVSYGCGKEVWIKCQVKDYHGSSFIKCDQFTNGNIRCKYCRGGKTVHPRDSFAQYLLDIYGEYALEIYWDYEKNTIDPWKIAKGNSKKKIYIKCQEKDYHDSYPTRCNDFTKGSRCGYCYGNLTHPLDSLGKLLENKGLLHLWSSKNKKSPYEYKPYSGEKVYFKCQNNKHDDFKIYISNYVSQNFRCPDCSNEQRESIMATTLKQVLKYEYPDTIWEHDVGFRGLNGGISRYDIFVPFLNNLLIECQSEYHDDPERQELDKLKKQYAIDNGYNYIAIDSRDYTPLKAIQLFFPKIKEIPEYVNLLRDTDYYWDLEKAQKLLNDGYTYKEVANIVKVKYDTLTACIRKNILKKPKDYKIIKNHRCIRIVCLDKKDNRIIKIYNSITEASIDIKGSVKNVSTICMVLKNKYKTACGYKWMYYDEYINNQLFKQQKMSGDVVI